MRPGEESRQTMETKPEQSARKGELAEVTHWQYGTRRWIQLNARSSIPDASGGALARIDDSLQLESTGAESSSTRCEGPSSRGAQAVAVSEVARIQRRERAIGRAHTRSGVTSRPLACERRRW